VRGGSGGPSPTRRKSITTGHHQSWRDAPAIGAVRGSRKDAEAALTAALAARDRGEQRRVNIETFATQSTGAARRRVRIGLDGRGLVCRGASQLE
jgi:hypothetical protein